MPGPCAIIIAYGPRASQRCGPRWAFYGRYARYIPPGRKNRKVFAEHDCSYLRLCSIFYLFRGATKMVLWAIVAHSVCSYVCNCVHFYCVPQIELVCTRLPPNLHQPPGQQTVGIARFFYISAVACVTCVGSFINSPRIKIIETFCTTLHNLHQSP